MSLVDARGEVWIETASIVLDGEQKPIALDGAYNHDGRGPAMANCVGGKLANDLEDRVRPSPILVDSFRLLTYK